MANSGWRVAKALREHLLDHILERGIDNRQVDH
jgi:hypothetical protein